MQIDAQVPPELLSYFRDAAAKSGVPLDVLLRVARQESNFNPAAVGRAGEIGVFQVMPSTARQPGFGVPAVDPTTLSDPRANIEFGASYLAGRGRAAGVQDWFDPAQRARALRAYNGGGDPNYVANVERWNVALPQAPAVAPGAAASPAVASAATPAPSAAPAAPAPPFEPSRGFGLAMPAEPLGFGLSDLFGNATMSGGSGGWRRGRSQTRSPSLFGP